MRKITKQMAAAYLATKDFKSGNTEVCVNENSMNGTITQIYLHGNLIAEHNDKGLHITNAGWKSNTTKERLNGLPGVRIHQKNKAWYLNGKEWDGEWTKI